MDDLHTMNAAGFPDKMGIAHFLLKDGTKISMTINYNPHYGDLISRFQINDKTHTDVKDKYSKDSFLPFQACDNLLGERPFENNSIVYEYLLKPLGIDTKDYPKFGWNGENINYTSFYHFKLAMLNMGAVQLQSFPRK